MPNALALKIDCAQAYNRILNLTVWISKWWNENLVMLITFERVNVREDYGKGMKWFVLKWSLVQILVTVAIIQIKNLKVEAEKGFRRTLFDPELVDPNLEINFVNRFKGEVVHDFAIPTLNRFKRKGNILNYTIHRNKESEATHKVD